MSAQEKESLALKEVMDQQVRIRNAARAAFQGDRDPLRIFAETVVYSCVAHVNAMILLQEAAAERMQALGQLQASSDTPVNTPPFPGVLRMFGLVPLDPIRFRMRVIIVATIILLAVFGIGVIVGKF